jgi:mRNA-degrading endonuclease RelE of RelBE toxin-antitoxin system
MEVKWHSGARQDLRQFESETQKELLDHVEVLEKRPLGEHTSIVSKQGLEIYRLKLKQDDLDHRVFFELNENRVVILGVQHRDDAYTQASIQELKSRQ